MSDKITVKLCREGEFKRFLKRNADGRHFHFSEAIIEKVDELLSELPAYEVEGSTTLLDLAHQIWNEETLVKKKKNELTYEPEEGVSVHRQFYCYQFGKKEISLNRQIKELHIANPLILVYSESWIYPENPEYREMRVTLRRATPLPKLFQDFAVSSLSGLEGMSKVFIYNSEQEKDLFEVLKERHEHLSKTSDRYAQFSNLAKPNKGWSKDSLEYWGAKVENERTFQAYRFLGFTKWMPYSISELKDLLPFKIKPKKLPYLLIFEELKKDYILVELSSKLGMNKVFEVLQKTDSHVYGMLQEEKMSLRLALESEILEPAPPNLQSAPGSLARKEEALAAVRERKKQEEAGERLIKVPYEEVNKAYAIRGAVIESFGYYKQKFKEAYPAYLEKYTSDQEQ